jgi:hypothetical protein
MWVIRNSWAYSISVGELEGKIIFERHNRRWKDNIKMYHQQL